VLDSPCMSENRFYIERRYDGKYKVMKPGADKASDVTNTQKEAIERAREMNPGKSPDVERVRNTDKGRRDKWRRA
jgi:uncharacterized protein YdaT